MEFEYQDLPEITLREGLLDLEIREIKAEQQRRRRASMKGKTLAEIAESDAELKQRLHRLQAQKRRLERGKREQERRNRNHGLIVFATHFLTYHRDIGDKIGTMSENEIKAWIDDYKGRGE